MKVVMVCLGADKKRILKNEFDIPMTKELKEGVDDMCNLSIGVFKKGLEEGMDEATVNNIKSLIVKKGWDIEECMDLLDIPRERWDTYRERLASEMQLV